MSKATILAVDDEAFNLDILTEFLEDDGYEVVGAVDGQDAWEKLSEGLQPDVVVLDRMMPRMDGMAFLQRIKADDRFRDLPVIMQTAAATHDQVRQGIDAGVFYYLTKPYEEAVLLSLVRSALDDARLKAQLRSDVRQQKHVLGLLQGAQFRFRTLEDARTLAVFISNGFPEPERVVYGLSEIMINAVEHGNLGISYEEKSVLIQEGTWQDEVDRRLQSQEQLSRFASLRFEADEHSWSVTIHDQGTGFDCEKFLELSPERATDSHGRGIATARLLSFDSLEYSDGGTTVACRVSIPT
jgi:CheY-like chemotaxis protein